MAHSRSELARKVIRARAQTVGPIDPREFARKAAAEGGCGVIGIASSVQIEGRHLLQSLIQMRNRGNGKGGGAAIAGLDPSAFGVDPSTLSEDYLIAVAYLDRSARPEVESQFITQKFDVDHTHEFPLHGELDPQPPNVVAYFARPKLAALEAFAKESGLSDLGVEELKDEFVYQNSYQLNRTFYAALGDTKAFVLSHGKDLLVLKLVGFGDDVFRVYGLEDMKAHVWIGHHRYPTKGRVWHPGGAHPFVGLHEALVHNGDFANYASVCSYLAQHNIRPLFLTDTEVSALVFDLHHRTFNYPLEYVIETLAPTTERDFAMLPADKREIYGQLQASHIHGSPDGPWFFLLAQSLPSDGGPRDVRLIGITDTSMLRPQVFALQQGEAGQPSIGFAASEKQAIDAALQSLSESDGRFWTRPDLIWNARGGSHTDGGAFLFNVVRGLNGEAELQCQDKFGRPIEIDEVSAPFRDEIQINSALGSAQTDGLGQGRIDVRTGRGPATSEGFDQDISDLRNWRSPAASQVFDGVVNDLRTWSYLDLQRFLGGLLNSELDRRDQLELLSLLLDRRYDTGNLRRSSVLTILDHALSDWLEAIRNDPNGPSLYHGRGVSLPEPEASGQSVVLDATGFLPQGPHSLALEIGSLVGRGFRDIVVMKMRGQRFIANGLGSDTSGVRIDIYGSSGDYLASGIDGAEVIVHGAGQDQLAQIMKTGKLVVHGDVGQTFMYGAKGGQAFVMGNAAGRPLINAVGRPRVVINGTCLDYLAESFMAGDPLADGGFVVLNGISFDGSGDLIDLETPYPGGNLFSLASGGGIYLRDPNRTVGEDQLNGGRFSEMGSDHWEVIKPLLEENERLFGIPISRLLRHKGSQISPEAAYRVVLPGGNEALQPEQDWVPH
jgi:glutamate synthase domain-containing protein 1/glutamate synthase domain-containing protein 3